MRSGTVAMVQSSYIPWKGYFDQINMADLFVFYDDVQFTKEDWRSRNRIKTRHGLKWLTVPCGGALGRRICDVRIESDHWQKKHWELIRHSYRRAKHFDLYREIFEELYRGRSWERLSDLNQTFTRRICSEILGVTTRFADSREYVLPPELKREDRWIALLERIGASKFVIGPSARNYLSEAQLEKIRRAGIRLVWMDYSGYPEYDQLHPPFVHEVSIVDLIFSAGPDAPAYMKSFG